MDAGDVGVPALEEHPGRHEQHGHVHQASQPHRGDHVDFLESEDSSRFLLSGRHHAALRQAGVHVDHVRHDCGADNPDSQDHRVRAWQAGDH